ncbi:hypothetical protein ASF44_21480 [Pseudorhodoferax sp. Leaf274]|nr:hypothetical protein ASF44_21480 [Pseudorhodoferax sp. Leaf274]
MKIGGFTQGATQAERQMDRTNRKLAADHKKLRDDLEKSWASFGTVMGASLAGAATAAFAAFKTNVNSLDAFNDLRDITGSSVENLSALDSIARQTGASFDTVQSALVKFNLGLSGMEDGGSGAAEIIRNLGLSVTELKALDPAEALRRVAVAFGEYGDTASKARNVQALFGKSVAEVGPFLKDLAEQQRLVGTTTDEAVRQSELFNKHLSSMRANVVDLGRSLTSDALPAINTFLQNLRDIHKIGGLGTVIGDAAKDVFGLGKLSSDPGADIKKLMRERDRLLKDRDYAGSKDRPTRGLDAELKEIEKLLEVSRVRQANGVLSSANEFSDQISRRFQRGMPTMKDVDPNGKKGPADDPTKNLLANQLKEFDRLVQEQTGLMADRNRMLELYNAQGLVSIRDYHDAQRAILEEATAGQVKAYDAQIAALEKYRASATKKTDRAEADGKIAELVAKRAKVEQEAGLAKTELDERQKQSTKQLADSVQDLTTKMMQLRGESVEAAKINFDKANEGLRKMLEVNGDQAGLANLNALRDAAVAQATLNDVTAKFALIQSDLSDAEQRIQFDREAGIVTELEGLARTGDARRERLQLMQAEIDRILALKAVMTLTPEQEDALRKLTGQVNAIKRSTDPIGDNIKTSLENMSTTLFSDLTSGSKSATAAIKDFGKSVLNEFNSLISKKLGQELMKSLFGTKTTADGEKQDGIFGSALSGIVKWLGSSWGFAEGGYTGAGGKYQPAGIVHRGEGVLNQGDMAKIGGPAGFAQLVSTIRSGRSHAGGGVGGASGAAFAPAARGGFGDVNIYNQAGAAVTAEKRPNANGGMDLIVMIKKDIKNEIGGELATDSGVMGQAMRARRARGL